MTDNHPDRLPPPLRGFFAVVGAATGLLATGCGVLTLVAGMVFYPRSQPLGHTVLSAGLWLIALALAGWLIWWAGVKERE